MAQYEPNNPRYGMALEELLLELDLIQRTGYLLLHAQDRESNSIKAEVERRGFCIVEPGNAKEDGFTWAIGVPYGGKGVIMAKRKPKKYYIVDLILPWSSLEIESGLPFDAHIINEEPSEAVGFCPVYTNRRKALKAFPGASLQVVVDKKDYENSDCTS